MLLIRSRRLAMLAAALCVPMVALAAAPNTVPTTNSAAKKSENELYGFPPTPTPAPTPAMMTEADVRKLVLDNTLAKDPASFSIVYNGSRRSMLQPCGCVTHKLGGFDKEATLISEMKSAKLNPLQLDGGGVMRDNGGAPEVEKAKLLIQALGKVGYKVLNVGYADMALTSKGLQQAAASAGLKTVSANLTAADGSDLFDKFVIEEVTLNDGTKKKIGIVGVSRGRKFSSVARLNRPMPGAPVTSAPLSKAIPAEAAADGSYIVQDPLAALEEVMPELRKQCDLVVGLFYARREQVLELAPLLSPAARPDFIIAGEHSSPTSEASAVAGTYVVNGGYEGKQVGQAFLKVDGNKVAEAKNRLLEVTQNIPLAAALTPLVEQSKQVAAPVPASAGAGKINVGQ